MLSTLCGPVRALVLVVGCCSCTRTEPETETIAPQTTTLERTQPARAAVDSREKMIEDASPMIFEIAQVNGDGVVDGASATPGQQLGPGTRIETHTVLHLLLTGGENIRLVDGRLALKASFVRAEGVGGIPSFIDVAGVVDNDRHIVLERGSLFVNLPEDGLSGKRMLLIETSDVHVEMHEGAVMVRVEEDSTGIHVCRGVVLFRSPVPVIDTKVASVEAARAGTSRYFREGRPHEKKDSENRLKIDAIDGFEAIGFRCD